MKRIACYPILVFLLTGLSACRRTDSAKPNSPKLDDSAGINTSQFDGTYLVPYRDGGHEVTFRNGKYTGGAPPFPSGDVAGNGTYTIRAIGDLTWELNITRDIGGDSKTILRKDGNDLWMGEGQFNPPFSIKLTRK